MVRQMEVRRKLVVVGDGASGKTCMLIAFADGTFNDHYVPTIFESTVADVQMGNQRVQLALWDTAGQEEYDRLRTLSYPDAHIVLICFAIDNPDSLDNVEDKWAVEVQHFCRNVPYILVGTKLDLRTDPEAIERLKSLRPPQDMLTHERGEMMALRLGAHKYLECSAKTREGIKEVFQEATEAALRWVGKQKRKCILM